ncbi:MAG: alpha-N-arabinofuranosidase [Lachnospiraceae bacterium]|nr:alpha-N-arabinofuranosidase [Lachnospiraceae bacterium]
MTTLYINPSVQKGHINPELQGQFSEHLGRCIYEGLYVGEKSKIPNVKGMRKDVVDALKKIHVPVLRWPGGCFADEYHWKDGIGPKATRKRMVNTHWGGVVEDNSFGTHEFMELCKQIGCKTYINGNLGSGTVQEMSEWVEYMTFDGESPMSKLREKNGHKAGWTIDYFGVGNENWGCGGNMRPVFYADEYRRYQTYVRDYRHDGRLHKICCGANAEDYNWTKEVLATCFAGAPSGAHGFMDGLSLHYYTLPGDWVNGKGSATDFDTQTYYHTVKKTLFMEELIKRHGAIMDQYDPEKKIGLIIDEWGTWYEVEPGTNPGFLYQQNTMRDAIIAGINLNLFNKNCDRVKMANIAQMVNVLQSMILTDGDKMVLTPTYHVFDLYQKHQDAELVESTLVDNDSVGMGDDMVPRISESVSRMKDGKLLVTLVNLSAEEEAPLTISLSGEKAAKAEGRVLSGEIHKMNTFKSKNTVKPAKLTGLTIKGDQIKVTLPACSVAEIVITQ